MTSATSRQEAVLPVDIVPALRELSPEGVYVDVDLSELSRWRIGGIADLVVSPGSVDEVRAVMAYIHTYKIPYVVLGSSANLLFADEGLKVLGLHLGSALGAITIDGDSVWSEAGAWVPGFARSLANAGLEGAEHTCGIPGTLGGLLCMNGGSQRRGIGDNVTEVTTVTEEGELRVYDKEACGFAYRTSVFQERREIIVSARFTFQRSDAPREIRRRMLAILRERRNKFPRKLPNCGSVFVSNPAMYADYGPPGAVIERCGLKGLQRGGAEISPQHANFINNRGSATANDVLYLIEKVRRTVLDTTGYDMPAEARFVTSAGAIVPAHTQAHALFGDYFKDASPVNDSLKPRLVGEND
ncbi:UDP-N-acetylmuramate dehydrogenase [Marinobacter sp. 1Y8]